MSNETGVQTPLHSLILLEDFKAIVGLDDREDTLSRYCLITATFTIEQYCKRRLLLKRHFERIAAHGDLFLPLGEYPVREMLACYSAAPNSLEFALQTPQAAFWELVEPELYRVIPDFEEAEGLPEDTVYSLSLSPALNRGRGLTAVKAVYRAGYACDKAPPDLASACLELAAWNMSHYRGRRIGMTGAVRGNGKDGEHLEASMPENVRQLLEPYRRRVI
jgi:hypothetical protein